MSVLPPSVATISIAGPQNTGPHRLPCHAKAGQRSPRAAQRSACTVHAPAPPLWLTHAQRKRTDDGDSPPWLYPTATPESRWRPDTPSSSPKGQTCAPTPSVTVVHARPHSATRRCSLKRKLGENQAPLQRVVGAFVHKRREDGSEGLTTLHTTPHQSPHRAVPIAARAHSLSLTQCSRVQRARELLQPWRRLPCFSCCFWPCSQPQVSSSGSARCSCA